MTDYTESRAGTSRGITLAWGTKAIHCVLLGLKDDPPPGVSVTFLTREYEANEMLQSGELDAANATNIPLTPNRSLRVQGSTFKVQGGRAAFSTAGFTPVNHLVGIQRRVVEENPWFHEALFDAFERSKQEAYRRDPAARLILRKEAGLEPGDRCLARIRMCQDFQKIGRCSP